MNNKVICPECGSEMELKITHKYKYKGGLPRKFYGCSNFPNCRATHGAHPDGSPLGVPGDNETKRLRIEGHKLLNQWQMARGYTNRKEVYEALSKAMNTDIHFGELSSDECLRVIDFLHHDIVKVNNENKAIIEKLEKIRKSVS